MAAYEHWGRLRMSPVYCVAYGVLDLFGFKVFCASPLGLAGTDPLGFRVFCASPLGLACTDPLCWMLGFKVLCEPIGVSRDRSTVLDVGV